MLFFICNFSSNLAKCIILYNMDFNFLPDYLISALRYINVNYLNEIRIRVGQPILIEYQGQYKYLGPFGVVEYEENAIRCHNVVEVIMNATDGDIFRFTEQLKEGFITASGCRIGIAGRYIIDGNNIITLTDYTSINIRIPHEIRDVSAFLFKYVYHGGIENTCIISLPGLGKTTMIADLISRLSHNSFLNVCVLDERMELSMFKLGKGVDVIRGNRKLYSVKSAIRVLKPDVIVMDEIYGADDEEAVRYAQYCGIKVCATSHTLDKDILVKLPFSYYVNLTSLGGRIDVYDKDYNLFGNYYPDNCGWCFNS